MSVISEMYAKNFTKCLVKAINEKIKDPDPLLKVSYEEESEILGYIKDLWNSKNPVLFHLEDIPCILSDSTEFISNETPATKMAKKSPVYTILLALISDILTTEDDEIMENCREY